MQLLSKIALECPACTRPNIIQIVSHNHFVAELLANYLESNAQLDCRRLPAEALKGTDPDEMPETCLVILDATDIDLASQWEAAMAFSSLPTRRNFCALYNVDPHTGIDTEALRLGIRGLFYRNDTPEAICKGIVKILDGEIWYRRETLFNCIVGGLSEYGTARQENPGSIGLTVREKRILRHLSRGASNQDIADQMVVSIHTVKSHLYKIYRKINVPNRLQATLWATTNLDEA